MQRLRLPDRPGQRPGRTRARPEGRSAARLPRHRRPRGARSTSRGIWGIVAGGSSRARAVRLRDARRARPRRRRPRALRHRLEPVVSAPERAATSTSGSRALDLLVVCRLLPVGDRGARRRRAARRPVGRGRRDDDEPRGRVIRRRQALRAAGRRAHRPRDPQRAGGRARAARRLSASSRAAPCSTSCGARRAGGRPTTRASPTSGSTRGRRVLALPVRRTIPARRASSPSASPPRRPGALPRACSTHGPPSDRDEEYPALPHDRPRARALPVGHPDPARRRAAAPRPEPLAEMHPRLAARSRLADGDRVTLDDAARRGDASRVKLTRDDPRGHGVRAVPLGRTSNRPTA